MGLGFASPLCHFLFVVSTTFPAETFALWRFLGLEEADFHIGVRRMGRFLRFRRRLECDAQAARAILRHSRLVLAVFAGVEASATPPDAGVQASRGEPGGLRGRRAYQ